MRAALAGTLTTPGESGWDDARQAWNLAVDQHPGAVASAASAADLAASVDFARERGLRVAVQGTGHGAGTLGPLEGTLLLKTDRLAGVAIDPATRFARLGAGALWGEVAVAAGEHGLAAPAEAGVGEGGSFPAPPLTPSACVSQDGSDARGRSRAGHVSPERAATTSSMTGNQRCPMSQALRDRPVIDVGVGFIDDGAPGSRRSNRCARWCIRSRRRPTPAGSNGGSGDQYGDRAVVGDSLADTAEQERFGGAAVDRRARAPFVHQSCAATMDFRGLPRTAARAPWTTAEQPQSRVGSGIRLRKAEGERFELSRDEAAPNGFRDEQPKCF